MRTSARAASSLILLLGMGVVKSRAVEPAKQVQPTKKNEPARKIEGWGVVEDPTVQSKIDFDKKTLTLAPATRYVDNFPKGMVNAPRVVQEVSGDFTVQVKVIHVDDAKLDSVLKSLADSRRRIMPARCSCGLTIKTLFALNG